MNKDDLNQSSEKSFERLSQEQNQRFQQTKGDLPAGKAGAQPPLSNYPEAKRSAENAGFAHAKKIVILSGIFPPTIGGPATHSEKLAEFLWQKKYSPTVITLGQKNKDYDFPVVYIPKNYPLRSFFYLIQAIRLSFSADLLYAQDAWGRGLTAFLVSRLLRKKYIVRTGGDFLWESWSNQANQDLTLEKFYQNNSFRRSLKFQIIKIILKHASLIITPSQFLKNIYEKYYQIKSDKIITIANPIPLIIAVGRPAVQNQLLYAGRFIRLKNIKLIIKSLPAILARHPDIKLTLIGDGPDKKELRQLTSDLNLGNNINFLGSLPSAALQQEILRSKICLLASFTDCNPNFILESLALKKPVLLTQETGLTVSLPAIFTFDPHDIGEFTTKLNYLLDNYSLATAQINPLDLSWNWDRMLNQQLITIKQLIEGQSRRFQQTKSDLLAGKAGAQPPLSYYPEVKRSAESAGFVRKKILSIGLDKSLFQKNSDSAQRQKAFGQIFTELHIIVFSKRGFSPTQLADNVFVYPTNSLLKIFYFWDAYFIAKKLLNGKNWIITTQDPYETGILGWILKKKFHLPLLLQLHIDVFSPYFSQESFANKIRALIARFIIPQADRLRVVASRLQQSVVQKTGFKKIAVLPVFIDPQKFQTPTSLTALRQKYSNFKNIILLACRLVPQKNIELAINAVAEVIKKHPQTLLLIVGDGPAKSQLENLARQKISHNVIFEPWTDNPADYFQAADLFLLTSNYEGYGRTIPEAMAASLPVVMTDTGLAGEFVIHDRNGLVTSINHQESIVQAITSLIENPSKKAKIVKNARQTINYLPTLEQYLIAYRQLFQELTAKNLLIITQTVDARDPILGFFHEWLAEFARQSNSSTKIICLKTGEVNLPDHVEIKTISAKNKIEKLWQFSQILWQWRRQYTHVFVHMTPIYLTLAGWWWRLTDKKTALWYTHKSTPLALKLGLLFCDRVFTASPESFRLASKKTIITGHGIDTALFTPSLKKTDKRVALNVARIAPVKRQLELVKIFHKLFPQIPDAQLWLIGEPRLPQDHAYLQTIKDYVSANNLQRAVKIIGPINHRLLPDYYQQATLLVNLSQTDSLDKDVLEAMACNLPVITTNPAFQAIIPENTIVSLTDLQNEILTFLIQPPKPSYREIITNHHGLPALIQKIITMQAD